MKVSIVTCLFNRGIQTYRGLKSLSQQVSDVEFVIVDDGSTDNSRVLVEKLISEQPQNTWKYIYLDHPEHRISCIPRNVGFKNSTGEIVIFTESEVLHVSNTVEQMIRKFEEYPNNTHIGSQIWTIQEKIYKKLSEDHFERPITILNHPYAQLTDSANLNNTKAPDSDWAITGQNNCSAGCAIGIKREWFEDIGGFDEEFEGHGGDDFNLYDRLINYGKGIMKHDDIVLIHQWHEKNYPYNIYDMAEKNLTSWHERLKKGEYKANVGKAWGIDK